MTLFRWFRPISSAPVARERLKILLEYDRNLVNQTDLFAVLREEITIKVGPNGETAALFRLKDPADVRRFLNEEPIEARQPSALYRFRKLARRNKVALTTAALVGLALVNARGVRWGGGLQHLHGRGLLERWGGVLHLLHARDLSAVLWRERLHQLWGGDRRVELREHRVFRV